MGDSLLRFNQKASHKSKLQKNQDSSGAKARFSQGVFGTAETVPS
jgi:hypothetical protein